MARDRITEIATRHRVDETALARQVEVLAVGMAISADPAKQAEFNERQRRDSADLNAARQRTRIDPADLANLEPIVIDDGKAS